MERFTHIKDFEDEVLHYKDGGWACLSWMYDPNKTNKGIIMVLTGIAGGSKQLYNIHIVRTAIQKGYDVVIVNNRGKEGLKLTTPKMYWGTSTEDVREAIEYVHNKYPNKKIFAIGHSLGAVVLSVYINEVSLLQEEKILSGAVWVCTFYDKALSAKHLENYMNGFLSKMIAKQLHIRLEEQRHMFPQMKEQYGIDPDYVLENCNTLHTFVDQFNAKMFGYGNAPTYYEAANITKKLKNFKIKTLFISSIDDQVIGPDSAPREQFKDSQDTYLMLTHAGGHWGYYYRLFSSRQWFNIPAFQFIEYLNSSQKSQ